MVEKCVLCSLEASNELGGFEGPFSWSRSVSDRASGWRVHQRCAYFSSLENEGNTFSQDGTPKSDDDITLFVYGRAHVVTGLKNIVRRGLQRACLLCKKMGASIKCGHLDCTQFFHYPCAMEGNTYIDGHSRRILCNDHTSLLDRVKKKPRPDRLNALNNNWMLHLPCLQKDLQSSHLSSELTATGETSLSSQLVTKDIDEVHTGKVANPDMKTNDQGDSSFLGPRIETASSQTYLFASQTDILSNPAKRFKLSDSLVPWIGAPKKLLTPMPAPHHTRDVPGAANPMSVHENEQPQQSQNFIEKPSVVKKLDDHEQIVTRILSNVSVIYRQQEYVPLTDAVMDEVGIPRDRRDIVRRRVAGFANHKKVAAKILGKNRLWKNHGKISLLPFAVGISVLGPEIYDRNRASVAASTTNITNNPTDLTTFPLSPSKACGFCGKGLEVSGNLGRMIGPLSLCLRGNHPLQVFCHYLCAVYSPGVKVSDEICLPSDDIAKEIQRYLKFNLYYSKAWF